MATKRDISRFKKMTNAQKRVAICRDVLAQLDLGLYIPESTYFRSDDIKSLFSNDSNKITHESIRGKQCSLCAKGALMVSRFGKFNSMGDFCSTSGLYDFAMELGKKLPEFSEKMANDIERCFERELDSTNAFKKVYLKLPGDQRDTLSEQIYVWDDYSPEDRLRIIMANIIRNKGDFKPMELLEYEVITS